MKKSRVNLFGIALLFLTLLLVSAVVRASLFQPPRPSGPVTLGNPNFYATVTFNNQAAVMKLYGSARDTFAFATSIGGQIGDTVNFSKQVRFPGDPTDSGWNRLDRWAYRESVLSDSAWANLYPMSGYSHFHLGYADPNRGAPSIHFFRIRLDGFGCFCDDGATNLADGPYQGFGLAVWPNWWDWSQFAIDSRYKNLPVCQWDGTYADAAATIPRRNTCYFAQGRQGVTPHDGNEFLIFSLMARYDPNATLKKFTVDQIVTAPGGDMEMWMVTPDDYWLYYGPIPANSAWVPSYDPVVKYIFFHDYNSGNDANGNPAPRHTVNSITIHI